MDISVVSGTYNRLSYLQKMVSSVRNSLSGLHGLDYEIVLVDGGSSDGTIAWCKEQPDIKLIEHGALYGAVKAFNDGAFAATGKYVIMANDDITFIDDAILLAYIYMETRPNCGGGCFYQNRNGRDWHVEGMPAVQITDKRSKKGKQIHVPYAQVGMFHKWLGDMVHWWCDEEEFGRYLTTQDYRQINDGRLGLHTYGGDNELSARIIDLGYTIDPIPNAKISDDEADDELRKVNNIAGGGKDPRSVKGHHPDSWKWGKKWFRRNERLGYRNLAGPIIGLKKKPVNPMPRETKERVLYLPLFEQGWQVQKEQKRGLRDALAKRAIVHEFDYMEKYNRLGKGGMMAELTGLVNHYQPTIFLSQLHNVDQINANDIKQLKEQNGFCRFVNWNGDYWPDQQMTPEAIKLARSFDLMTCVNRDIIKFLQGNYGINISYWQIGWEPDGRGHEPEANYDIAFLASGYSSKRQELGKFLTNQPYSVGLYGHGWPDGMSKGENLYNFKEACKVYRGTKLAIGDSQWPESGFVSNRIFQILAAGNCVLTHQWFRDYDKLGLVNEVNCLIWQNLADLEQILKKWLSGDNIQKLSEIAANGEKLAIEKHSFDSRVDELWQMLGVKQKEVESWRW